MIKPKFQSLYNRFAFGVGRAADPAYNPKRFYKQFGELSSCRSLCTTLPDEVDSVEDQLRQMALGADIPGLQLQEAVYADVSEVPSLEYMLNARNQFMRDFESLPARIRREFDDDPEIFAEILDRSKSDQNLRSDLVNLGVLADSSPSGSSGQRSSTGASKQTQTASERPVGEPAPEQSAADQAAQRIKRAADQAAQNNQPQG